MSKPAALALGAVIALTMASPATAQRQGGYSPPAGVITPEARSRVGQTNFERDSTSRRADDVSAEGASLIADCIVRRSGNKAGSYLGGVLAGAPEYARIAEALSGRLSNCAEVSAAATASAISGALAERLVLKEAPALADRAPTVAEDAAHRFFGELKGPVTLDNIAGCLAVYSPGLAYKVLKTKAGSSDEGVALEAVYKETPECGMPAAPATVPASSQRGALATALYKWSHQNS